MESPRPWLLYAQLLIVIVLVFGAIGTQSHPGSQIVFCLHFGALLALGLVTFGSGWRAIHGQSDLSIYRNNRIIAWGSILSGSLVGVMACFVLLLVFFAK